MGYWVTYDMVSTLQRQFRDTGTLDLLQPEASDFEGESAWLLF